MDNFKIKYNFPDYNYITCRDFGKCDGMDGSCHYCLDENPYQFEMCSDESWKRSLMSPLSKMPNCAEDHAIEFINNYKNKHYNNIK
jgi:hypothetical protein